MINKENYTESLVSLYHLVSSADGKVSSMEEKLCKLMIESEEISEAQYDSVMQGFDNLSSTAAYSKTITALKKCDIDCQTRILAWARRIANADGYMAKEEWALIFKIYKKELDLNLKDIISCELPLLYDFI